MVVRRFGIVDGQNILGSNILAIGCYDFSVWYQIKSVKSDFFQAFRINVPELFIVYISDESLIAVEKNFLGFTEGLDLS